jgi:hypothetical protein
MSWRCSGELAIAWASLLLRMCAYIESLPFPRLRPLSSLNLSESAAGASIATRNDLVVCGNMTFDSGAVLGGGNAVYVPVVCSCLCKNC